MLDILRTLDRRWVYLAMLLAIAVPLLTQSTFPEKPARLVRAVFDKIENLPEGSSILLSLDYAPSSDGELSPMSVALVRHCCLRRHKMYFMTLWPDGLPIVDRVIRNVIKTEFEGAQFKYGEDYVNLGYKPGLEVVIKVIGTDLRKMYSADNEGNDLDDMPMTKNITNIQDMDLLINISAGSPGAKEWVQYAATPFELDLAVGSTAVQSPQLYPYIPDQMFGLLAAIKGAAEYDAALAAQYPRYRDPKLADGIRRMAPQLWAHLLMIVLIVLGNVVYFADRRQRGRR